MNRLSPDSVLFPGTLSAGEYSKLVSLLSEDDNWKKVAECFGIFSCQDIKNLSHNRQPAEILISELGSRLCTIEMFCEVLHECRLYSILILFREHEPVHITQQPCFGNSTQMVARGMELKLTCKAVGFPPPMYQWYCDNKQLESCQNSVLCINNFGLENEGEYYCVVSQEGHSSVSSSYVAILLAPMKPVIHKQPIECERCQIGTSVILSVVAEGHPQLKYQWFKGNTELKGCTEPHLKIVIENKNQAGIYCCYISNCAGEIWSNKSQIIINSVNGEPSAKVALLIGNQLYDNLDCLSKPESDVRSLADIFLDLGFSVIALQNLRLIEMKNSINLFSDILPKDAYVIFYFSGHGFETCDKFMLPVDIPGPEDYLQTDALSEKELLQKILSTEPKLFVELLDMCLKAPNAQNKKIFDEKPALYHYEARNNLIQGYATTSYLSAYETRSNKNGLYVKFLSEGIKKNKDLPILEILKNVAKDFAKACPLQIPFFGTNVTEDYRFSDPCIDKFLLQRKIEIFSSVPCDTVIHFKKLDLKFKVSLAPFLNLFLNTLHICVYNLEDYKLSCETDGEELIFELSRINQNVMIKIMNVQRLIKGKLLILCLYERNGKLVDSVTWDIGKPLIAVANLWREE